jgi:tRNA uridine 5-carboxymethylaminomethyl modification enzyme
MNFLESVGTNKINQKVKAMNIALRPQVKLEALLKIIRNDKLNALNSERFKEVAESAEIKIKYEGYIQREK